ncbi:MAG: fumarate hydratase [Rhodoglobus sp.]|nr:fumarate hydratase [Rhodoglobus sp.]
MGVVFVWGVFAPRSQWRALSGWSVSDPHVNEPGGAAYFARRLLSGMGLIGLAAVMFVTSTAGMIPVRSAPPLDDIERMWGSPAPQFVERVFLTYGAPPPGLAEMPLIAYQAFEEDVDKPDYFLRLDRFTLLGESDIPGYIGQPPDEGFSAIGFADLVVQVRGPMLCIPRETLVVETEDTVTIAVYYGLPDPEPVTDEQGNEVDAPAPDHVAGCSPDDPVTASLLIPVDLAAPVGDRRVLTLDGDELREVPVPTVY